MGEKLTLDLEKREVHGKKVARLRREGIIPAVVYGSGLEPVSVMAPAKLVEKVYKDAGMHHPVHLKIDGKARIAMIKDVDLDPVKRRVRHVSFHAVKQGEKVEADIPIKLVGEGESAAEKAGLVVLQTVETVSVKAAPMDLPDQLEASIVELAEAGQHVSMADITLPKGVEYTDPEGVAELVIASVYEPSALQAANEAAGGDAEPGDEAEVDSEEGSEAEQPASESDDKSDNKPQEQSKE